MLLGLEMMDAAAAGPLLIGIPESAGVLALGVGLISFAGIVRWVLGRRDSENSSEDRGE